MYVIAFIIILFVSAWIIYLFSRKFLSESLIPNKIVRFVLLLIIGVLVSSTLSYIYSRLDIEASTFGVVAALIFVLWLEIKKDSIKNENKSLLQRVLLSSFIIIGIFPLLLTLIN
ncbi:MULTISPECIES: hypothetical protein [Bacillaceae]|uniref:DUF1516 family protein n=1 Tax=Evansella alkalicola TaxID=745819 RepID=A0ABS6JNI7_9BACI|nr:MULTISPECIES: hypothetical protein [Bacillaceae]MBU9720129.1 hypothetical protein [Bacillus alkalicola]